MIGAEYFLFVGCLLFLLLFSTKRDTASLWIILISSIVGILTVVFFTRQIHAPWKLVIPGALEILTIAALVRWSKNLTGYLNVGLLSVAWLAHVLCYIDLWTGGNIIYDNYETVLYGVAVGQLASFHDTAFSLFRRVTELWTGGDNGLPAGSASSSVLHPPSDSDLQ